MIASTNQPLTASEKATSHVLEPVRFPHTQVKVDQGSGSSK